MKTLIIFFIIIISASINFPQTKTIKTGLYLVIPQASCYAKSNKIKIGYLSDTLCLEQKPVITVKDIDTCITARAILDGKELYVMNIALKQTAKTKFKEVTERNVGKKMALVIDRKVVMAAVIRDPVTTGRLTVSGEKEQEINLWAKKLREEMKKK